MASNQYSRVSINPDWEIVNGRFVRKQMASGIGALPPAGYFDPAITNLSDAAHRQFGYMQDDTSTGDARNITDYFLARQGIERGNTRGLEDLASQQSNEDVSYGRGFADRQLANQRGLEDYNSTLSNISRQWAQRGAQQTQQGVARGVTGRGASLLAAAKRQNAENRDRTPVVQGYSRFRDDQNTAQNRAFESHQGNLSLIERARGRLGQDTESAYGQLDLESGLPSAASPLGGRSWQDRHTALTRGGVEDLYNTLGSQQQAWYQAAQNGFQFPALPSAAPPTSKVGARRPTYGFPSWRRRLRAPGWR